MDEYDEVSTCEQMEEVTYRMYNEEVRRGHTTRIHVGRTLGHMWLCVARYRRTFTY